MHSYNERLQDFCEWPKQSKQIEKLKFSNIEKQTKENVMTA